MAGGSYHEYKDIVVVNMMKSVPDGIIIEPNEIQVEYSIVSDAKSTEEIIKYLACEYGHITSYFDELTNAINTLSADVQTFETDIENRIRAMEQSLSTLLDNLEHVGDRMVIYDPTKGTYVDSKIAMRDMYHELAVFGARVNQIATKTVDDMATHRTDETAAVGNLTIFNDATPRVTDPKTGNPYTPIQ